MIGLKDRLLNAQQIIQGPYQKINEVQLRIYTWSFLEGATSYATNLQECKEGLSWEKLKALNIEVSTGKRNQIQLRFPVEYSLKHATLLGWDTLWAGSKVQLHHPAGQSHFEVSLPAQGWWRLENASTFIDVHATLKHQTPEELGLTRTERMRALFQNVGLKWAFSALVCHVLLFLSLTQFGNLSHRLLNVFTPESEKQEEPEQTAVQVVMTEEDFPSEDSFQGRSLFPAMTQKAEAQTQPTQLSNKLKNLANLFGSQPSLPSSGQRRAGTGGQNPSAMTGDLKSLQAGLLAQNTQGGGGSATGGRGNGPRAVHWKSQFASGAGGKGLTEGQAQMLSETFAKKQDQFRGCYESALLQFEELAVTVSFEAEINKEGLISKPHFTLSGRYTPDSQNQLLECLKQTVSKIKVDSKLSGIKIKNQFIFKS